jgi:hypothetical protein
MLEKIFSEITKDWYIYSTIFIFLSIPAIVYIRLRSSVTKEDLELFEKMNFRR